MCIMEQNFYLGIDVSKGYADFVILSESKEVIEKNFQLDDTFEGHNRLYEVLSGFIARHTEGKLFVGAESTGGYENNLLGYLSRCQSKLRLSVARINPYGVSYSGLS
jgi:transposase